MARTKSFQKSVDNINNILGDKIEKTIQENLYDDQNYKRGLIAALEIFLRNDKSYKGYSHIYWVEKGYEEWKNAGEPDFPEKKTFYGLEYNRNYP